MNSFNKPEAAVFSCRLCFKRAFHFISFFKYTRMYIQLHPSVSMKSDLNRIAFCHLWGYTYDLGENLWKLMCTVKCNGNKTYKYTCMLIFGNTTLHRTWQTYDTVVLEAFHNFINNIRTKSYSHNNNPNLKNPLLHFVKFIG